MVASQIKYWVFGIVGVVGAYILLTGIGASEHTSLGMVLVGGMIMAMILGGFWDTMKSGETAATYQREARDEKAKQEWLAAKASGAKQIESPKVDPTNEQGC